MLGAVIGRILGHYEITADRDGLCIATASWPPFEALWNEPRFNELLKRAGLGVTLPA